MGGPKGSAAVIATCFLVIMTTSLKHVWSVFIPSVESSMHVGRSLSVLPFSLLNIANIVGFLVTGRLKAYLGLKRLLALTAALMSTGLLTASLSPNIEALIASFAFIYGLGNSFAYVLAVSTGVKVCGSGKGVASGLIVSAYSFGVLILSPLTTYLIRITGDWRKPLMIYSAMTAALVGYAAATLKEGREGGAGTKLSTIVKSREFPLISAMLLLTTVFDGLIAGNLAPMAEELTGAGLMTASLLVSTYSAAAIVGRLVTGALSEWLGVFKTLLTVYAAASINSILFTNYRSVPLMALGVSISSIMFSANAALSPVIALKVWGDSGLEGAYGLLLTSIVCGVMIGPALGGYLRDLTGSYSLGIRAASASLIAGTLIAAYVARRLSGK